GFPSLFAAGQKRRSWLLPRRQQAASSRNVTRLVPPMLGLRSRHGFKHLAEFLGPDRLHQVGIEAGLLGKVAVLVATVPSKSDEDGIAKSGLLFQLPGHLITIQSRQLDVEQD